MPSGANTNQAGTMFANKKEYTADEIVKNFIAVNEELKKNGFTYYQLPSASMMQIWENGKLVPYFPDMANMSYPATVGPKGSITDYKNPNFDEALMRKYTDAKSLSDQLQQKISSSVRGAMGSAADPSKVDVAGIVAGIYSSQNTGGRGITLSQNDPQKKASSLKISNELKKANAPFNQYNTPPRIDTDSLIVEAVRNNDADNIVALRKVWGAQPAAADTGLDPKSDEFQYLSTKKSIDAAEKSTAGAYKATVAENEAALKTAWANFKSVNDELKAKGYSYLEASEGVYGTALNPSDPKVYIGAIKKIDGPKGNLNSLYARYEDGRYLNPEADPSSPQYDKSLSDLNTKAGREGGIWSLTGASSGIASAQYFKDIQDRLVAKGVDLVKLEQDNPYGVGIPGNNQVVTFGAKASTGQTNLPQTAGTQDPYDILGLSADAAKRIIGLPDKQRGGGAGGNLMQANTANQQQAALANQAQYYKNVIGMQNSAAATGEYGKLIENNGYFTDTPYGLVHDQSGDLAPPTYVMVDTGKTEVKPNGTVGPLYEYKQTFAGGANPLLSQNEWAEKNGYDYYKTEPTAPPDTGGFKQTLIKGAKGEYSQAWDLTGDPSKKSAYQKYVDGMIADSDSKIVAPVAGVVTGVLVGTNVSPAAAAASATPATPATPAVQAQPTNPDYNPALVHPELNPTGSIQKQLELNAFFKSPNPDIQASLISELNPTGSLKKQADLNNYFASLPPAAPPAVPAAPAAATAAVNYSATLPQTPPTKAIGKNGELVGISPTKGGAITTAGITPGTTASPYAQTAVPTFTTRAPYTQPSPRQYP